MADEPVSNGSDANADAPETAAHRSGFHTARPSLNRGFDDYSNAYYSAPGPQPARNQPASDQPDQRAAGPGSAPANRSRDKSAWWSLSRLRGQRQPPATGIPSKPIPPTSAWPDGVNPLEEYLPEPIPIRPRFWQKQPYSAIAHIAALSGTVTAAWLLGLLVAQLVPGTPAKPPLQEAFLRKSSRLTSRLWHFPQLWHTPTAEIRVEAIPLPETGPVLTPIDLPPLEKQPLLDELNNIETEIITLDRRLQTLEERLGKPPYQGADIENRVNSLRAAIDPPVRAQTEPDYEPVPHNPNDDLLEVAKLKIVLPSDALFAPGQSDLKEADLLDQVLDQLVNYPEASILIRSYSDNQAGAIASREYTLAQANALRDYLQTALPGQYRWVTLGGGQSQPITSNDDVASRQRNRRIEISVDTR